MTTRLVAMIVALLAISVAPARADDEDDAPKREEDTSARPKGKGKTKAKAEAEPAEAGAMVEVGSPKARMTLPGGKFVITAVVEANMAKDTVGKPLSVAPDLWIGVHDRFSFGLVHSGRAATGFLTGFGTGLCFRGGGATGFCGSGLGDVYTFAGAEARLGLTEGGFALALVAGMHARAFDPELVLSSKAGFLVRLHSSRIALEVAPSFYIGVTQREFNVDTFGAPVTMFFRLAGSFAIALQGGVAFVLKDAGNTWQIPAAVGFSWWVTPHISFDAAFGLAAVADSDDMTKAFDRRSISVGLGYAL